MCVNGWKFWGKSHQVEWCDYVVIRETLSMEKEWKLLLFLFLFFLSFFLMQGSAGVKYLFFPLKVAIIKEYKTIQG